MILVYIIKSTLCFGILFGFYKLVLESKAMHQFKRFYLLASLVFAFIIPLVTFTYTVDTLPEPEPVVNAFEYYSNPILTEEPIAVAPEFPILPVILWSIYGLGVLIFGLRFVLNLVRLKRKINASQQIRETHFTLSLLSKSIIPHSFLKWIFLNKKAHLNQEIAPEVLAHEATHVRQKHSWDILFIEFVQIVFWFNPLVWIAKKSIKLNHEFLADQGAIDSHRNIAIYQNILLSYASSTNHTALESPFNYSLTKKRILMLSQTFSRKRAALSALLLLPIVAVCLFLFNNEIKAQEKITHNQDPISQFIEGAKRNGHKPLVIEVKNDLITINGKKSSLPNFQKDIDTITQDWEETDYTDASTSYLFKDNSQAFMKALEKEYIKTHISKANGGSTLLPPPPPAPKSVQDLPPPPPPSVEDHLFKMNRLGGVFYYENKKVTYKKALSIVKSNTDLNIKTPFPYGNTPKTFISRPENLQEAKLKKEEVQELQKKYVSQKPVTKEEITIYNRLAKKYNAYNGGEIKQGEVARMYDIYSRMTAKQKKRAESYPVLPPPPPPPPAPTKVIKDESDGNKGNPPPPPAPSKAALPLKKDHTQDKVTIISKTSSSKEMFTPSNQYPNTTEVLFEPGKSLAPTNSSYQYSETYQKLQPKDMVFYENGKKISDKEGIKKIATKDYFMDIKGPIEGSSKIKIELTKKPWSESEKILNRQFQEKENNRSIQTEKSVWLKSQIEINAMNNGVFEINN